MQPLNRSERSKAFWSFFLFFLITAAVVVAIVSFSVAVPLKDNKRLLEQSAAVEKEREALNDFGSKLSQTKSLIDSIYEFNSPNAAVYAQQIESNLSKMYSVVEDPTLNLPKDLLLTSWKSMSDYKNAKSDAKELAKTNTDCQKNKEEAATYKMQYLNCLASKGQ